MIVKKPKGAKLGLPVARSRSSNGRPSDTPSALGSLPTWRPPMLR